MDIPKRTRTCDQCRKEFSYEIKRGADRKVCSKACAWESRKAKVAASLESLPCCAIDGCCSPAIRVGAGLCEKHHARLRRLGSSDLPPLPYEIEQSAGYLLTYAPSHPLTTSSQRSRVYTHRKVYHDAYGEGPFDCYHCGAMQTWATMHIDHLDDDVQNNILSNLVASCPTCNTKRGIHKMVRTMQARGTWITYGNVSLPISEFTKLIGLKTNGFKARLKKMPLYRAVLLRPGPTSCPRPSLKR